MLNVLRYLLYRPICQTFYFILVIDFSFSNNIYVINGEQVYGFVLKVDNTYRILPEYPA